MYFPDEIRLCFPRLFMCLINKGLLPISSWKKRATYHLLFFVSNLKGSNPLRQETKQQTQQMIYLHWKICLTSIKRKLTWKKNKHLDAKLLSFWIQHLDRSQNSCLFHKLLTWSSRLTTVHDFVGGQVHTRH